MNQWYFCHTFSGPHLLFYLSTLGPLCHLNYFNFRVNIDIWWYKSVALFFVKMALVIFGCEHLHINLMVILLISQKEPCWNIEWDGTDSIDNWEEFLSKQY